MVLISSVSSCSKIFFEELRLNFRQSGEILSDILVIFAASTTEAVDLYTIQMISKRSYDELYPVLSLLCRYLILEKLGESYRLNQFAKKYIIQMFLPDETTYEQIAMRINSSYRSVQNRLKRLQDDVKQNDDLRRIIRDWHATTDGDKIAIANAYSLYGDVRNSCQTDSKRYIESEFEEFVKEINSLECTTMHPYVKFQKARILQMIHDSRTMGEDFSEQILSAYYSAIWTIKNNPIYFPIQSTRSYASVLWLYAIQLLKNPHTDLIKPTRYLEESRYSFEQLNYTSDEYYQCLVLLGETYLKIYRSDSTNNFSYLIKARSVSRLLYDDRQTYSDNPNLKRRATELSHELRKHKRS